jgi:hypothetical protein
MIKLSVIIINYNTPEMTEQAVRRLRECEPELALEIILIDNDSTEKLSAETVSALGLKYIENRENVGFARAVNQGIKIATSGSILLLNSDVLVEPGAVSKLLALMEKDQRIGVVGPKMIYPDGREQASCGYFPDLLREFIRLSTLYKIIPYGTLARQNRFNARLFDEGGEADWLSGGCMLVRREAIDAAGQFDEHYFFGVEDIDFCFRAKQAGFKVFYLPQARVIHHHGLSSGGPRTISKMEMERDNLNYFLKKNLPNNNHSRKIIRFLHNSKIWFIKLING